MIPCIYYFIQDIKKNLNIDIKYENNEVFCFISLYGIEPNFVEIVKKEDKKE